MGFKDQVNADLDVFLNLDEFAETHNIDGRQVKCIIDLDDLRKFRVNQQAVNFPGVYGSYKTLFVKAADLPNRPVIGQHLKVDGELYLVVECSEPDGMLEVSLEVNEA